MKIRGWFYFLIFTGMFTSCKFYTKHILFRADKEKEKEFRKLAATIVTPPNYLIQKNDFLEFFMLTNKGEVLVDPTSEFAKQVSGGGTAVAGGSALRYLVQYDGKVELPILGRVKVDSLTLSQCDSFLTKEYSRYYQDPFVKCKVSNRRVFLLGLGAGGMGMGIGMGGGGAMGGGGTRVIQLDNENMTVLELFASSGVPAPMSYSERIKIIRGNLKNPTIFTLDFTRYNSFQGDNVILQPNDIIYIEPRVRFAFNIFGDISIYTSILSTILTLVLISRL